MRRLRIRLKMDAGSEHAEFAQVGFLGFALHFVDTCHCGMQELRLSGCDRNVQFNLFPVPGWASWCSLAQSRCVCSTSSLLTRDAEVGRCGIVLNRDPQKGTLILGNPHVLL